ncbi:MAG TPA: trehalose-phosphatase [Polyangia bacterium]
MLDIFSRANVGLLGDFARSNLMLAFDYDGTLAPIVASPERADLRARTRILLAAAARLYPVVIISGRAQADLRRRLSGIGAASIVANHGLESWHRAGRAGDEVRRWLPRLADAVAPLKGVTIEDKVYSVAVHYRRSREKKLARKVVLRAAAELPEVRIVPGKQVVNILPLRQPNKGVALERERERLGCDTAIYVGDDKSDEDVFALDQPGRLLSIRVGAARGSAAPYFLRSQRAMDGLLRTLVAHRRARARSRVAP